MPGWPRAKVWMCPPGWSFSIWHSAKYFKEKPKCGFLACGRQKNVYESDDLIWKKKKKKGHKSSLWSPIKDSVDQFLPKPLWEVFFLRYLCRWTQHGKGKGITGLMLELKVETVLRVFVPSDEQLKLFPVFIPWTCYSFYSGQTCTPVPKKKKIDNCLQRTSSLNCLTVNEKL